jgi:sugar phosphate isomerase/epimerase
MPKYSIYTWYGFPVDSRRNFKLIKAAGFDGVLLWWSDEYNGGDGDKLIQMESARNHGLFIENIHTPFWGVNELWRDNLAGEHHTGILTKCIAECGEYEIPVAVVHVSGGDNPPPPGRIGLERIKRLVGLAEAKKVNLALENLRHPEYLDYIFGRIQSERLGFCYDSGHANCYSPDQDLLARYGAKLMALHLHDNDGTGDRHQIPGEGNIDWQQVKAGLRRIGYEGAIALEVIKNRPDGDVETPEQYLERVFSAANRIFETAGAIM